VVPIPFEVRSNDRIVVVSPVGPLVVDDCMETARDAIADPRFEAGFGLLIDGGRINPLPTVDQLRELVRVARELQMHGVEPFALVAVHDLHYLVAKLFTTIASASIGLNARVFRSREVAVQWLKVSNARGESLIDPTELGDSGSAPTASA
jgi:hypothetical protein